jgi:hypothetical protein
MMDTWYIWWEHRQHVNISMGEKLQSPHETARGSILLAANYLAVAAKTRKHNAS